MAPTVYVTLYMTTCIKSAYESACAIIIMKRTIMHSQLVICMQYRYPNKFPLLKELYLAN